MWNAEPSDNATHHSPEFISGINKALAAMSVDELTSFLDRMNQKPFERLELRDSYEFKGYRIKRVNHPEKSPLSSLVDNCVDANSTFSSVEQSESPKSFAGSHHISEKLCALLPRRFVQDIYEPYLNDLAAERLERSQRRASPVDEAAISENRKCWILIHVLFVGGWDWITKAFRSVLRRFTLR